MSTKILIIDTFEEKFIKHLSARTKNVVYIPGAPAEVVGYEVGDAEILILNSGVRVDRDFLDRAESLRLVVRAGVGLDHIDLGYASEKGILVKSTPGGNANSVGEHALGVLLMLLHHLHRASAQVRQFQWKREENRGRELGAKTVGIIGYGNTGRSVAKKLSGFGCKVLAYDKYLSRFGDRYAKESTLEEIKEEADILSFHVPLTKETQHMGDWAFFKSFARQLVVLNFARGEVVDLESLILGLDLGKISAAGLDVLENEKLDKLTPKQQSLYQSLFERDNVIVTPHIGGWSYESRENMNKLILGYIDEYFNEMSGG